MSQKVSQPLLTTEAISPLDGRYRASVVDLATFFSEGALVKARVHVEVEWLVEQAATPELELARALEPGEVEAVRAIAAGFDATDAERVKELERSTDHDVKAVEYFLGERLDSLGLGDLRPLVHFGCTSEDVNNLAYGILLHRALAECWMPAASELAEDVAGLARTHSRLPLLSRTHGQPATPSTLGKELAVFAARWRRQLAGLRRIELLGKFNGAVGTFGAHVAAYPDAPWERISRQFVERLGLTWSPLTTQIEAHDYVAEVAHGIARYDVILADFAADMSAYIAAGVFRQIAGASEVGSSTMPHKVNPIRFENAEANVGIANAVLEHLARKLPVSRLQRDLSDSSTLRNLGVGLGHSLLAIRSARRGLAKVEADETMLRAQLADRWEVLAEPIQTVLRKCGHPDAYERLKDLTRSEAIDAEALRRFVEELELPAEERDRLLALTPERYTGLAHDLVVSHLPRDTG